MRREYARRVLAKGQRQSMEKSVRSIPDVAIWPEIQTGKELI
jgi:hypothetical protein